MPPRRIIVLVVIHLETSDEAPDADHQKNAADPVAGDEPIGVLREAREPVEEIDTTDDTSDDPRTDESEDHKDAEAVIEGSSDGEDRTVHRDRDESNDEADNGDDDEHEDPCPEVSGVPELLVTGGSCVTDEEACHLKGGDQREDGVDEKQDNDHSFTIMRGREQSNILVALMRGR